MKNIRIKTIFCLFTLNFVIASCGRGSAFPEQGFTYNTNEKQEIVNEKPVLYFSNDFKPEDINAVFQGTVVKILPDDLQGLKHQQFMFKISSGLHGEYNGEVVIVAHNIEVAPYVPVQNGIKAEIKGDFIPEENPKVLHWTHLDLTDIHPDGYIKVGGKIYQ
jgi:hypothetical protein